MGYARIRTKFERIIVAKVIKAALAEGYQLVLNDDDGPQEPSTDGKKVLDEIFEYDEMYMNIETAKGEPVSWFRFIRGNDGWDVISDYSANPATEAIMEKVMPLVKKFEYMISG